MKTLCLLKRIYSKGFPFWVKDLIFSAQMRWHSASLFKGNGMLKSIAYCARYWLLGNPKCLTHAFFI